MANVVIIAGILLGYNVILDVRAKDDQIAKLNAELEGFKLAQQDEEQDSGTGGNYTDGTYSGEAEGFGGTISVEVEVKDGVIENIEIQDASGEDGAYLSMAEDIIPKIIEKQSADVDTISGATFSSTGIKNAVAQALEGAEE